MTSLEWMMNNCKAKRNCILGDEVSHSCPLAMLKIACQTCLKPACSIGCQLAHVVT